MLDLTAYQRPEKIQQALAKKRIAVVGMSNNPARASNSVSRYMLCLLYTSPSPRDKRQSRMPSSA